MQITNNVDAVLLQILSALVTRARVNHNAGVDRDGPFNDVLGSLGRDRLRTAVRADGASDFRSYRLAARWDACFRSAKRHHEHVIPIDWWKQHLFDACDREDWKLDSPSLHRLRKLCGRLYLTAYVPRDLHKELQDHYVGWHPTGGVGDWVRYQSESVTQFLKQRIQSAGHAAKHLQGFQALRVPKGAPADDQEADFVVWTNPSSPRTRGRRVSDGAGD